MGRSQKEKATDRKVSGSKKNGFFHGSSGEEQKKKKLQRGRQMESKSASIRGRSIENRQKLRKSN